MPAPVAFKFAVSPLLIVVLQHAFNTGTSIDMLVLAFPVQPLVTATLYVVFDAGLTTIELAVAPVLHT